jgi:hypothetical protein
MRNDSDTLRAILDEQRQTNKLLTILVSLLMDQEEPDDDAPTTYLSGAPVENPQALNPNPPA